MKTPIICDMVIIDKAWSDLQITVYVYIHIFVCLCGTFDEATLNAIFEDS